MVTEDQVTIEDLGSKNGTFLKGRRLEGVAVLEDGDTFRLGNQVLVFRRAGRAGSTITER